MRAGRPVHVFGSLDRRRDVTDARDVARAAVAALSRGLDGPCNVGTGTTHRLGDLLDAVVDVVGRPADVRVVPAAREEVAATRADTTRCQDVLGVRPRTDLADLVARQVAHRHRLRAAG